MGDGVVAWLMEGQMGKWGDGKMGRWSLELRVLSLLVIACPLAWLQQLLHTLRHLHFI